MKKLKKTFKERIYKCDIKHFLYRFKELQILQFQTVQILQFYLIYTVGIQVGI